MNPLSKIIAQFGMIHLGLVGATFLITRTLVKLYFKSVPPDLQVRAKPLPWLAEFISSYGWWLSVIPVCWCLWTIWTSREEELDVMTASKSGWLVAAALAVLLGLSVVSACMAWASPVTTN